MNTLWTVFQICIKPRCRLSLQRQSLRVPNEASSWSAGLLSPPCGSESNYIITVDACLRRTPARARSISPDPWSALFQSFLIVPLNADFLFYLEHPYSWLLLRIYCSSFHHTPGVAAPSLWSLHRSAPFSSGWLMWNASPAQESCHKHCNPSILWNTKSFPLMTMGLISTVWTCLVRAWM